MERLFAGYSSLVSVDFKNKDLSRVERMESMFEGCSSLKAIDLKSLHTPALKYVAAMFKGCRSLTSLDLSMLNMASVTTFGALFSGCTALREVDLSSFPTAGAAYGDEMFKDCQALETIRCMQPAVRYLKSVPVQSGWYLDRTGPYALNRLPALSAGQKAVLSHIRPANAITPLLSVVIAKISSQYAWTGKTITPKPVITCEGRTLREGTDYTLSYVKNVDPGKAELTVKGIGSCTGSRAVTFLIVKNETPAPYTLQHVLTIYQLYNPNSGEHFYTFNPDERKHLITVGWKTPDVSKVPVYRLYNSIAGDHHYTLNKAECDMLITVGWRDEGIGWYTDGAKAVPLYRQYNPNAKCGIHNYTPDKKEHEFLISAGWKNEGIAWYGVR